MVHFLLLTTAVLVFLSFSPKFHPCGPAPLKGQKSKESEASEAVCDWQDNMKINTFNHGHTQTGTLPPTVTLPPHLKMLRPDCLRKCLRLERYDWEFSGFGALLKGTSAVLWRCPGTFPGSLSAQLPPEPRHGRRFLLFRRENSSEDSNKTWGWIKNEFVSFFFYGLFEAAIYTSQK